jgi:hypothetical protein
LVDGGRMHRAVESRANFATNRFASDHERQ